MADRSTSKHYTTAAGMTRCPFPIANGVTLPVGTLVQEESGFANHFDGTVGHVLLGIVMGGENPDSNGNPVGDTSLTPDPAVYVDCSGALLTNVAVASSTVIGAHVYCDDSDLDNMTITQPGADHPIGIIVGWRSATDCDVKLYTPTEYKIGTTAAATLGAEWTT